MSLFGEEDIDVETRQIVIGVIVTSVFQCSFLLLVIKDAVCRLKLHTLPFAMCLSAIMREFGFHYNLFSKVYVNPYIVGRVALIG